MIQAIGKDGYIDIPVMLPGFFLDYASLLIIILQTVLLHGSIGDCMF
jgi:hypothetical protein